MTGLIEAMRPIVDFGMIVLIWIVQLVVYPAFRVVEPSRFVAWHHGYMRSISLIVMPLMLVQAMCIIVQISTKASGESAFSLACIVVAWLSTFLLSVPCHRRLQEEGNTKKLVDRIVATNWIRTVAWTLVPVGWL